MGPGISKYFGYKGHWGTSETLTPIPMPTSTPVFLLSDFDITSGKTLAQVELDPGLKFSDASILNVTLTRLDRTAANFDPNREGYDVFAIIEFGNDGVQTRVQVDFTNGRTFSVPGSFVRVMAVAVNLPPFVDTTPIRVGAFITVGTFARRSKLTRTFNNRIQFLNGIVNLDMPPFATAVQIWRETPTADIQIDQMMRNGFTLLDRTTVFSSTGPNASADQHPIIALSSSTQFIRVFNPTATPQRVIATYEIEL